MVIPRWLQSILDESGAKAIETAVAEAESTTAGEIVPVIVRRSSTVGHVPLLLCSLLLVVALVLYILLLDAGMMHESVIFWLIATVLIVALTLLGSRCSAIQRLLTSLDDRTYQTELRAEVEFFEAKLTKTEARTGILLFASLMERRAVVLADKAISEKLPLETWNEVVQSLISGMKQKDARRGFTAAIATCGEILTAHLPVNEGDKNELPNRLIIKG